MANKVENARDALGISRLDPPRIMKYCSYAAVPGGLASPRMGGRLPLEMSAATRTCSMRCSERTHIVGERDRVR